MFEALAIYSLFVLGGLLTAPGNAADRPQDSYITLDADAPVGPSLAAFTVCGDYTFRPFKPSRVPQPLTDGERGMLDFLLTEAMKGE